MFAADEIRVADHQMVRRGFRDIGEVRGLLSVPPWDDEACYERAGYVIALQAANRHDGPW